MQLGLTQMEHKNNQNWRNNKMQHNNSTEDNLVLMSTITVEQTPSPIVASIIPRFESYTTHTQVSVQKAESEFHQGQVITAVYFFINKEGQEDANSLLFSRDKFIWQDVRKILDCLPEYQLFIDKPQKSATYH